MTTATFCPFPTLHFFLRLEHDIRSLGHHPGQITAISRRARSCASSISNSVQCWPKISHHVDATSSQSTESMCSSSRRANKARTKILMWRHEKRMR
jgi:hypothetical protein